MDPGTPSDDDYEAAIARYGVDAVHDAIVQRGADVLTRGLPYLLWAARYALLDRVRKERRREHLAPTEEGTAEEAPGRSSLDPYELACKDEQRKRLLDALAKLPEIDALVLWWNAEGLSDKEIAKRLLETGTVKELPSEESLRKRRQRGMERIRIFIK